MDIKYDYKTLYNCLKRLNRKSKRKEIWTEMEVLKSQIHDLVADDVQMALKISRLERILKYGTTSKTGYYLEYSGDSEIPGRRNALLYTYANNVEHLYHVRELNDSRLCKKVLSSENIYCNDDGLYVFECIVDNSVKHKFILSNENDKYVHTEIRLDKDGGDTT